MRQSNLLGFQQNESFKYVKTEAFPSNQHAFFMPHTHTLAHTRAYNVIVSNVFRTTTALKWQFEHTHRVRKGTTKNSSEIENNWNRWQAQHALKCATHAHIHTQGQTHRAYTLAHLEHLTALRGNGQHVWVCVCRSRRHTQIFVRLLFSLWHIESHFAFDSEHWNCCRIVLRCRWRIRNIAQASIESKSPKKNKNTIQKRSLTAFYYTITGILCAFHM